MRATPGATARDGWSISPRTSSWWRRERSARGTSSHRRTSSASYGAVKTTTGDALSTARERVTGEIPTVRLGASGGVPELDRCDGTFTEMLSYEHEDVPTVWAAHNNCGGDVVLPWDAGERIRIAGSDQVYEIVDIRHTSKIWATTDDLVGLDGDLALQTCHYGEDRMKFIGLRPVPTP